MKFRAYIEHGSKELELDFDIDDEAAAHARLAEALTKIQKLVKKPERASTAKATDAARPVTSTPPLATGGAK